MRFGRRPEPLATRRPGLQHTKLSDRAAVTKVQDTGRVVLIHSLLLAFAAAAQAGSPPAGQGPVNRDSVWAAALARLSPRSTIRVHRIGDGRIEGPLARASATTLLLAGIPEAMEYPVATLDSLWVRGNSAKTGAIIGGISLAVAGAAYGAFANEVGCQDDGGDPCPEAIPLLGLAGAATGALLGALIGSAIPRWHLRVP